jgi:nicotinamidase/pyrazinamidase
MGKRLIYGVDLQYDFMNHNGNLYVPKSEKILNAVNKIQYLVKEEQNKYDLKIAFSIDEHDGQEPEMQSNGGLFPVHCMKNTIGCELISNISLPKFYKIFPKRTYDIFDKQLGNSQINDWLEEEQIKEVWIYGLVGNICVEAAVRGFIKRGIETYIWNDAVVWMDLEKGIFSSGEPDNKDCSIRRLKEQGVHFAKLNI